MANLKRRIGTLPRGYYAPMIAMRKRRLCQSHLGNRQAYCLSSSSKPSRKVLQALRGLRRHSFGSCIRNAWVFHCRRYRKQHEMPPKLQTIRCKSHEQRFCPLVRLRDTGWLFDDTIRLNSTHTRRAPVTLKRVFSGRSCHTTYNCRFRLRHFSGF